MRSGASLAVLAGLIASASSIGPTFPESPPEIREHVIREATALTERGNGALARGNLRGAERRFDEARKLLPSLPEPYVGLGHVRMQRREFEAALGSFREAERRFADQSEEILRWRSDRSARKRTVVSELHQRRAILRQNLDRIEGMVVGSAGRKARRQTQLMNDLRAEIQRIDGRIRFLEEHPEEVERDPSAVPGRLHFFIGNALLNLGRLDDAIEAWQRCVHLEPSFALAWNNLAVAYWKVGEPGLARVHLDRARSLGFPINPELERAIAAPSRDD